MDIKFRTVEGRFNYRVAGILIHNDQLLIMKDDHASYFYVPGGRVHLHESAEEAVRRELREELGIEVRIERLLWTVENFFVEDANHERYHELGIYYLVSLTEPSILEKGEHFVLDEGDHHLLEFTWTPLDEIKDLYIYPLFLKERILSLPASPEHLIERKG